MSKTVNEAIENLNGFHEIAIKKAFDHDIFHLVARAPTTAGRALIFAEKLQEGMSHQEAHDHALGLTIREVDDSFEPEPEEVDDDEPETEAGKDDSAPA